MGVSMLDNDAILAWINEPRYCPYCGERIKHHHLIKEGKIYEWFACQCSYAQRPTADTKRFSERLAKVNAKTSG